MQDPELLPDDSSDDEDFDPGQEQPAGDGQAQGGSCKRGRGQAGPSGRLRPAKRGFMEVSDNEEEEESPGVGNNAGAEDADGSGGGDADEGSSEVEEEEEKTDGLMNPRKAARLEKISQIWEAMKAQHSLPEGRSSSDNRVLSQVRGYAFGASLAEPTRDLSKASLPSICQPIRRTEQSVDPDKHWMKHLGMTHKALENKGAPGVHKSAAEAALRAVRTATTLLGSSANKVVVTEKRKFAGQEIEVSKEMGQEELQRQKQKKSSGLDVLLESLKGDKKISVLDKSRHDWQSFKKGDAEVEEELETYKKSSDKYLDKQDFLKKAELRQYEIERDQRLATDARTRGRI